MCSVHKPGYKLCGAGFAVSVIWLAFILAGGIVASLHLECLPGLFHSVHVGYWYLSAFFPTILPFLFSAFAAYFSKPKLMLPVCFWKAFCFGFCGFGISLVYGQCSWLMRLLLMFSDLCSLPILLFYWLRYAFGKRCPDWCVNVSALSLLLIITTVDYCFISPFTVCLLEK